MSNNKVVINSLLAKRDAILAERDMALERFGADITEIEKAIMTLTGLTVKEVAALELYDDQHPDYIKASLEEM